MKNLLLLFVCIILSNSNILPQTSVWTWVTPYPTGDDIYEVYFITTDIGFIVGANHTSMMTTDAGATWASLNVPNNVSFFNIYFFDPTKGWIAGINDQTGRTTLLKTTDGGLTWNNQLIPNRNDAIRCIYFLDAFNGWVSGNNGLIFRTSNGGTTWENKSINPGFQCDLYFIYFKNLQEGIIFGNDYSGFFTLLVGNTSNGGNNWTLNQSGFRSYMYGSTEINEHSFVSVGEAGIIIKSTDNGQVWNFRVGLPRFNLSSVDFYDSLNGIAAGSDNFLITTDGGINWNQISSGYSTLLTSVQYVNSNYIVACGSQTTAILVSTNSGNNWINKASSIVPFISISGIAFPSNSNGWVAGDSYIFKSADGGRTWIQSFNKSMDYLQDIAFFDEKNGFACGFRSGVGGLILKTSDAGLNWQSHTISSLNNIEKFSFPDPDTVFAIGHGGIGGLSQVLRTTNAGEDWEVIEEAANIRDIDFLTSELGFVLSSDSIRKTTDGGNSWQSYQVSNTVNYILAISFPDPLNGYAAGSDLYKTSNGGLSWSQITTPAEILDILFIDVDNGWISTYSGIYSTTDGGLSWKREIMNVLPEFSVNDTTLYATGSGSNIMKRSLHSVVGLENEQPQLLPNEFILYQNYPNPFNSSTKLSYSVPQPGLVTLKVFDILGNEVKTLVNKEMEAGYHSIDFNGSDLPSSVYFYRIQCGNFIDTKKMILLK